MNTRATPPFQDDLHARVRVRVIDGRNNDDGICLWVGIIVEVVVGVVAAGVGFFVRLGRRQQQQH